MVPMRERPKHASVGEVGVFMGTLIREFSVSGIVFTVFTLILWIVFSVTDFRKPILPREATLSQDYMMAKECTLKVRLDTQCNGDIPYYAATLSAMAERWPHITAFVVGTAVTNLFLTVLLCDVARVKPRMLSVAWLAYLMFWLVVTTSAYELNETQRVFHFVFAGILVVATTTYAYLGTRDTDSPRLKTILGLLGVNTVALLVTGIVVVIYGAHGDGGGSTYDTAISILAYLEYAHLVLAAWFVWTFSGVVCTQCSGTADKTHVHHHFMLIVAHNSVHPHTHHEQIPAAIPVTEQPDTGKHLSHPKAQTGNPQKPAANASIDWRIMRTRVPKSAT